MKRKAEAVKMIEAAIREGRSALMEHEAKLICVKYGIPTPKFLLARSLDETLKHAAVIGYPLVAKVVSPYITHKSDVGGVKVDIRGEDELRSAYETILENAVKRAPNAKILGILVEEMVPNGVEVAVGMVKDPSFGPTIMFGLGGVFIEVLKDVSFRVAPLSSRDVEEMINEIKGRRILDGFRGTPPADIERLKYIIHTLSELSLTYPELVQIDLNPIIVRGNDAKVVDARMIIRSS